MPKKYAPVIDKLIQKSEDGVVPWKPTFGENTFILALEGEVSFEIEKLDFGGFRFTMKDADGKRIIDLTCHNRKQYVDEEWVEDDEYYEKLNRLFEAARVTALDVNKKLGIAEDLLDKF